MDKIKNIGPRRSALKAGENPDLVLIARLVDALILQLQNNTQAANRISEKAWKEHAEAWRQKEK